MKKIILVLLLAVFAFGSAKAYDWHDRYHHHYYHHRVYRHVVYHPYHTRVAIRTAHTSVIYHPVHHHVVIYHRYGHDYRR
jgi:hypothetical protein